MEEIEIRESTNFSGVCKLQKSFFSVQHCLLHTVHNRYKKFEVCFFQLFFQSFLS